MALRWHIHQSKRLSLLTDHGFDQLSAKSRAFSLQLPPTGKVEHTVGVWINIVRKVVSQWTNPILIKILNSTSLDKIFITV